MLIDDISMKCDDNPKERINVLQTSTIYTPYDLNTKIK